MTFIVLFFALIAVRVPGCYAPKCFLRIATSCRHLYQLDISSWMIILYSVWSVMLWKRILTVTSHYCCCGTRFTLTSIPLYNTVNCVCTTFYMPVFIYFFFLPQQQQQKHSDLVKNYSSTYKKQNSALSHPAWTLTAASTAFRTSFRPPSGQYASTLSPPGARTATLRPETDFPGLPPTNWEKDFGALREKQEWVIKS